MSAGVSRILGRVAIPALFLASGVSCASAQYFVRPDSAINPALLQIDERQVLGRAIDPATEFVDLNGGTFRWGDLAGKPTLLVLSYYSCDGICSVVNQTLRDLLAKATRVRPGVDFNLLTVSFDRRDNLNTTEAFRRHLDLPDALTPVWRFATFKSEQDLKSQTEKIGFKFFWSPEDGLFLHPGVFLFFTPKGELARVLYQQDVDARDIELAALDAREGQFKPSEVLDYALSLCYSYNYQDGKYRLSIPVFVGVGALAGGMLTLAGSALAFKLRRQDHAGENAA